MPCGSFSARWADVIASPLPALPGWFSRHCVTAYAACQPCGLVRPPLPRLAYCGLRPRVLKGEVSPCEPLWPAFQLVPRLPNPIEHTRPRGIHAPGHSFGVIQTMLLALPNFGLERMGREKPQQPDRFFAACGRMLAFGLARTARHIQYCRRSRCGLNRAYST